MRLKKIIQVFLMSLLCWTFTNVNVQAEEFTKDGIQVTIVPDKDSYQANEKAKFTVYLKNTNAYEVNNITVNSEIPKDFLTTKDSVSSLSIEQLKANETKEYVFYLYKDKKAGNVLDDQTTTNDGTDNKGTVTEDEKDNIVTGIDLPWLPLSGALVLSGSALFYLRKTKRKKNLLLLLLASTMGFSVLNATPVKAKTEKNNFQVETNFIYDTEKFKVQTEISYDKVYGDVNEVGEVTKEEWISTLVDTMGLSLEDQMDTYSFDDFDETENADKIETAIQYQFLDLKANEDNMILFEPKEFATREFVAYTTIKALGYVPTEEDMKINTSDIASLKYPGEDNIAIDLGMLYMIHEKFNPNQYVTKVETQNVLQKTKDILNSTKIDQDHVDKIEFQKGVTETALKYELLEDEKKVIVYDKEMVKSWKKDEIHVLYSKDKTQKDVAIKVSNIVIENDATIITYVEPKMEEVAKDIDLEGSKPVEGTFIPADGIELENNPQTRASVHGTLPLLGPMNFKFTMNKVEVKTSINLKEIEYRLNADLSWQHGIEINEIYFAILNENKAEVAYTGQLAAPIRKEIGKFTIPIGYGACATGTIYLKIELDGSIRFTFTNSNKIGIQYNNNRLRPILNIENDIEFGKVEGSLKMGVTPELGGEWFGFDLLKFGMDLGRKFETEFPDFYTNPFGICLDGVNYMYGSYYAQIGPDELNFKQEKEVYTFNNSPSKLRLHIEENGIKNDCTRNSKGNYKGNVKDALNLESPIYKAKIEVLKGNKIYDTTYSDRSGNFVGIKLSKGDYKLRVSSSNYKAFETDFQIIGGQTTYLETQLMVKNGTNDIKNCQGKIKNAFTGGWVNDATIKVYKQQLNTLGQLVQTTTSNDNGDYNLTLASGNYKVIVTKNDFMNQTRDIVIGNKDQKLDIVINPKNQPDMKGSLRFVLTWSETPRDLDSHLTGENIHVWYANKNGDGANLDVDDTTSYGPETITITEPKAKKYQYYVHDFTNLGTTNSLELSNSNAKVQVYDSEKLLYTFVIPSNQPGTLWHVFDINYETGIIEPVNEFFDANDPNNIGKTDIGLISKQEFEKLKEKE